MVAEGKKDGNRLMREGDGDSVKQHRAARNKSCEGKSKQRWMIPECDIKLHAFQACAKWFKVAADEEASTIK